MSSASIASMMAGSVTGMSIAQILDLPAPPVAVERRIVDDRGL